ncbi:MAG TPA: alkaline phosphatase D family protein [Bacteriovoracaceae bacterium]|nr:alkaline phosphatase D family protein [Bacteriovoracaceae bacterium]
MKKFILVLLLVLPVQLLAQVTNWEKLQSISNLQRIAFGSCNRQTDPQDIWDEVLLSTPDLFIWGGDNVYGDTEKPDELRAAYDIQNAVTEYKTLKATTPIIGNWDDHDYGQNDGNGFYKHKKESQRHLLDFLEEPVDSARRSREGIYTSYSFGTAGRKIKIIILDNRYFKAMEKKAPMLGSAQWEWLENELKNSDASLHLISSGLSIIAPLTPRSEEWGDYPDEVRRLKNLLKKYQTKAPLFLTGDQHFSSILERDGFHEFISSGMTHNTRIPFRVYVYARFPSPVFDHNFGLIDIDWTDTNPSLTLTSRNSEGKNRITKKLRWDHGNWQTVR